MRMICTVLLVWQMVAIACCFAQDGEATLTSIEQIHAAWRQRTTQFESIELSWKCEASVDGKDVDDRATRRPVPGLPDLPPPVHVYRFTQQHNLILSGERLAWNYEGDGLRGNRSGQLRPTNHKWAFDGTVTTHLWNVADVDPRYEFQVELYGDTEYFGMQGNLYPILLNVRPMDETRRRIFDVTAFKPGPGTARVSGFECVCLKHANNVLWVAPEANYSILRIEFGPGPSSEMTIEVKKIAAGSYAPSKWVTIRKDATGKVLDVAQCSVTDVNINREIPASRFEIEIPENTLVLDERKRQRKQGSK